MKNRFPGILWLLPICFGVIGGTVAAFISSMKYQASWWELFVAGLLVSVACYVFLILFVFAEFSLLG